jgi:hypothetical protein
MKEKNQIKGIMNELVESKFRKSIFEIFLSSENISMQAVNEKSVVGEKRSSIYKQLIYAKAAYSSIINNPANKELFNTMADLETVIVQARCLLASEVKLTFVNQKRGGSETSYVVARASFYNPENVKAEIRVYLGKTEEIGSDLIKLSKNTKFMDNAEKQIVLAMYEVMEKQSIVERIKKSSKIPVNKMVTAVSEEYLDSIELDEEKPAKKEMKSPYNPGPGKNPKPKGGVYIPKL